MAWDIRQTYYYLVCFATLIMVIIGAVVVVQSTLDIVYPATPYRPSVAELHERTRPRAEGEPAFTREELEQMAEEEAARMEQSERRRALRSLLGNLALALIAAPIYSYHWRQVRRTERVDRSKTQPDAGPR
jgi:hypothetical protein